METLNFTKDTFEPHKIQRFNLTDVVFEDLREETFNGQKIMTVNAVMINTRTRPVMNGIYFTPHRLEESVPFWENRGVFMGHPDERQVLPGFIMNSEYKDGKLTSLVNLNERIVKSTDYAIILQKIRQGDSVEGSMGIYTSLDFFEGKVGDIEPKHPQADMEFGAVINGQINPDHYAIIQYGVGACGNKDGCGLQPKEQSNNKLILLPSGNRDNKVMSALNSFMIKVKELCNDNTEEDDMTKSVIKNGIAYWQVEDQLIPIQNQECSCGGNTEEQKEESADKETNAPNKEADVSKETETPKTETAPDNKAEFTALEKRVSNIESSIKDLPQDIANQVFNKINTRNVNFKSTPDSNTPEGKVTKSGGYDFMGGNKKEATK